MSRDYAKRSTQPKSSRFSRPLPKRGSAIPKRTSAPLHQKSPRAHTLAVRQRKIKRSSPRLFLKRLKWFMLSILLLVALFFVGRFLLNAGVSLTHELWSKHAVKSASNAKLQPEQPIAFDSAKMIFSEQAPKPLEGRFELYLGSYVMNDDFTILQNKLKRLQVKTELVTVRRNNKEWYRLFAGPYKTEAALKSAQQTLRHEGLFSLRA